MADLATAYVQIIPSARGLKENLSNIFGSEMPSAGQSAGGIFGSNLVGKIKSALVAAGIGEALKMSLTEGANLEQSLGGIETMFKDSAAVVIANADQAYRTAGMSANAYMEQVTSFSASLLQSLGGDTAKSADIANMAMTDMSDNANKFGTDMERITDAYQGFAKQNYTMLDNLKLGYGGTKTEMERLLKDAQALTGVKYDINNLADVYSAIHAVQEELGVTGTTAKEAASTMTGSFNAMKGAFSNVLGNLATGRDLNGSLKALAQTSISFLKDNLIPAVTNIITALPGALVTLVNAMIPSGMQQIATNVVINLSNFLRNSLPTLWATGTEMVINLTTGFLNGIPGFIEQAGNLIQMLSESFISVLPTLWATGTNLILSLERGVISAAPNIVSSATTIIGNLLSTFAAHLPDLLAQGISLIGQLVAGLISMIPDVVVAAGDIATDIWNTICEIDWLGLGSAIIEGIVQGIRDAASSLFDALKELAKEALKAAKEALGINSPSKVFDQEVGYQIPAGEAQGIRRGFPLVHKALKELQNISVADFTASLRVKTQGNKFSPVDDTENLRSVEVNQYIYSEAKTAADLMREARYQAEKAVLLGV